MVEVDSLLVVLVLSLIITPVATVALTLTGMSQAAARFQARSALTGAGFSTSEPELVVNHPVRSHCRRRHAGGGSARNPAALADRPACCPWATVSTGLRCNA